MNAKDFNVYRLYGIYGELLTENQRAVIEDYFGLDLSLGEIAEMKGISRQAVKDALAKGEKLLVEYEQKLGFLRKKSAISALTVKQGEGEIKQKILDILEEK